MPKDQVTDAVEVEDVAEQVEATIQDGGVAEPATPAQPASDVEKLRQEYDLKLQTAQADLNKLKSSLQKREADITREYQQRQQQMEKELQNARLASMDEAGREKYLAELKSEEYTTLQKQLQEAQAKSSEAAEILNAMQFFTAQSVPADQLVVNQGYNALVESGWAYINAELKRLREAATNPTSKPPARKQAPDVITDKAAPSKGTTWKELRAKYGSEEAVYQAIENGTLDPSILPA
jgi:hypothetical protein